MTQFAFDHRGRQTSRTLPLGVASAASGDFTETMTYRDLLASGASSVGHGQLEFSVDFEGRVTGYLYDNTAAGGGRLVEKKYYASLSDKDAGVLGSRVTSAYDEQGREREVKFYREGALGTAATTTAKNLGANWE